MDFWYNENLPKIKSNQIDLVLEKMLKELNLPNVARLPAFWICARKSGISFQKSFEKTYLPVYLSQWLRDLIDKKMVIIPLIFYPCDEHDNNKILDKDETDEKVNKEFIIMNHYNVLLSYFDEKSKTIIVERYEPTREVNPQFNELLSNLFIKTLKLPNMVFILVSQYGLQYVYKDTKLCSYHILYYLIFRLKHTLAESVYMLTHQPPHPHRFIDFCVNIQNKYYDVNKNFKLS